MLFFVTLLYKIVVYLYIHKTTNEVTTMNFYDAFFTDNNASIIANALDLTFVKWDKSFQSESAYCYLTDGNHQYKIRFSLHDDYHFEQFETLGTVRITDMACFDPDSFGEDDTFTLKESLQEDYWIESPSNVKAYFNNLIVNNFKSRINTINAAIINCEV